MLMGDLFILSSVSTIKRYSSSIDMTLPIRSDLRGSIPALDIAQI